MQNKLYELHKDCEMIVNYQRCNTHGRPALCCATHKDKKGRHQWIDWVSKDSEDYLIEGLCCEVLKPSLNEQLRRDCMGTTGFNMREFMKRIDNDT